MNQQQKTNLNERFANFYEKSIEKCFLNFMQKLKEFSKKKIITLTYCLFTHKKNKSKNSSSINVQKKKNIHIVLSIGKSASISLERLLKNKYVNDIILRTHFISNKRIKQIEKFQKKTNITSLSRQIILAKKCNRLCKKKKNLSLYLTFRNPYELFISSLHQNLHYYLKNKPIS